MSFDDTGQFIKASYKKHERKASWTVVALAIIGVLGNFIQERYGSGDRQALWKSIHEMQHEIQDLQAQHSYEQGYQDAEKGKKK